MDSIFSSRIVYSMYKQYLELPENVHCEIRVALHKLIIARDDMYQYIDEPHRKYHQQSNRKQNLASLPIISGLWDVFYTTVFLFPHFVILICQ